MTLNMIRNHSARIMVGLLLASMVLHRMPGKAFGPIHAQDELTLYTSEELGGNSNQALREQVDDLDEEWRLEAQARGLSDLELGSIQDETLPIVLSARDGTEVEVSLRDFSSQNLRQPNASGRAASTQGRAYSGNNPSMQDGAPKPQSLYSRREQYYNESAGSMSDRNALLFTFSQPVLAFGAWFGDLETRTEGGGTPAIVRVFDAAGRRIGQDYEIVPSTPDQRRCGAPTQDDFIGCGNATTIWIGFVADAANPVSEMLVVVGDDDTLRDNDDGNSEHLSFIGPRLALAPPPSATPSPSNTPSPTLTPSPTNTSSPTSTPTDTPVPTATFTPSPTPTPTSEPKPVYLPILLYLKCPPTKVDIVLILDLSTSMELPAGSGRAKREEALAAAQTFVDLLDFDPDRPELSDQAAVIWFNGEAGIEQFLTSDKDALRSAIDRLPMRVSHGTRIDLALTKGLEVISEVEREANRLPMLILLTDGKPNGATRETVLGQAEELRKATVRVYSIGLGDGEDLDPDLLRAIASTPNLYLHAPEAAELEALYRDLAGKIRCPSGRQLPDWP